MDLKYKATDWGLLYLAFIIYSFISVLAKYAALQDNFFIRLIYIAGEILLLGIYAVFWQQTLKRFPLVVAMSNKGITVILGLVWSVLLFNEVVTIWNILGTCIIFLGIWLVSSDG